MMWKITALLCLTVCLVNCTHGPEVHLKDGKVRGRFEYSLHHKKYVAFEGIPYAKPPVGELRFQEPQSPAPWTDVLVSHPPKDCIQYLYTHDAEPVVGSEDCLYVNVYTPNPSENANLDVFVHIHGGGLMNGAGIMYGPSLLMDHDVVYVNFNYRLGILGFLSTEDEVLPGNNGMKDQSFALKWIKNNIHHFGGNPDSITITGLSAGGASVHMHYLSPLSRGLFKQGISMSGTALNPWPFAEESLAKAKNVATYLGCATKTSQEIVNCLKQRPAHAIVAQVEHFLEFPYAPFSPFGAVVDKHSKTPFLPDEPITLLKEGKVQDLPWLTSVTSEEGLWPATEWIRNPGVLNVIEKRWYELAPHILDFNYTVHVNQHKEVADQVKNFYLKGKPIGPKTFNEFIQLISDRHFVTGSVKAALLQAKVNKSPVYYYRFKYLGTHSCTELFTSSSEKYGVSHGDDLGYITPGIILYNDKDKPMADFLINLWKSFARSGTPTVEQVAEWPPVCSSQQKLTYVEISSPTDVSVQSSDDLGHVKFWDSLPIHEHV